MNWNDNGGLHGDPIRICEPENLQAGNQLRLISMTSVRGPSLRGTGRTFAVWMVKVM